MAQHRQNLHRLKGLGFILTALALVDVCKGQTFRFAHIRWTHCSAGFYDPYFPQVCDNVKDNLQAVGFTLTASWLVTANNPSFMLRTAFTDITNFVQSNGTVRDLKLFRDVSNKQNAKKIGWRFGLGEKSVLPSSGGSVDCPVAPCLESNSEYVMKIDRLSPDRKKVRQCIEHK